MTTLNAGHATQRATLIFKHVIGHDKAFGTTDKSFISQNL